MKHTITPKLEAFLRKEKVLMRFRKNQSKHHLNSPEPIDKISHAFAWVSTPEGHDFWLQISVKFSVKHSRL